MQFVDDSGPHQMLWPPITNFDVLQLFFLKADDLFLTTKLNFVISLFLNECVA